jgi:hypothetical protein
VKRRTSNALDDKMKIEENKSASETRKISDVEHPIPRSKLEEEGHSLLIVDLLRLARTFSYRRYRLDVIGFLLAWLWVALLLALGYWITRIGA